MNISTDAWVWFASIGMIAIYTFVYKENPIYRAFEHLYVGVAAGYAISVNFKNIYDRAWTPLTQDGKFSMLIPMILGLLLYTRFFKNIAYLSRWAVAFLVGVGAGLSIYGVLNSELLAQMRATMIRPNSLDNIVLVIGVLSVLFYFFFSMEQKGAVKHAAGLGRWVMMVTFGVSFGNVVMGRISLLLGTLQDMLGGWLGII